VTLLVVTAVEAERNALLAGAGAGSGDTGDTGDRGETGDLEVVAVGVGGVAAAAGTARLLATGRYRAVLSAGIGGGFGAPPGATVLGTISIAADLGADSPDGFIPLSALGFGADTYATDAWLVEVLRAALPDAVCGPILSVNTVTGTAGSTGTITARYPDAVAEGMEGFGVATAAAGAGVPFGELRTVSNPVGPRDRGAWRIGDALAALTVAGRVLGKLTW
jgi:futalosine hydrolase